MRVRASKADARTPPAGGAVVRRGSLRVVACHELVVDGFHADAQHFRGQPATASAVAQRCEQYRALGFGQRRADRDTDTFARVRAGDRVRRRRLQVERDRIVAQHEAALDAVLQFAHVAGPRMRARRCKRSGGKMLARPVLAIHPVEKDLRQQFDVLPPLPQRRQAQHEHGQPKIEILAQPAVAHERFRGLVRGGHDADVHENLLAPADPNEAARFEHAQQLCLQFDRHFGDFVEKQRAAARALEIALVLARGSREGAAFVAEQFGFHEARRDGAAVDGHEGAGRPGAPGMQQPGGDFLSRA